ncbi:Carboxylesterase NlhH [compost metagenome]
MYILAETRLHLEAAAGRPRIHQLPLETARQQMELMPALLDLPPVPLTAVDNLTFDGPAGAVPVRLYRPGADCQGPLVMFMHGGGWVIGSLDSHDSFCRHLSQRLGLRVLAVDYRRAPEHPFPAAYEDCLACLDWLLGSPVSLGAPVESVALAGDSAGGNLAAAICAAAGERIKAQLLLYPVLDASHHSQSYAEFAEGYLLERADMDYFIDSYLPRPEDRRDLRESPLLAQSFAGHAPTVLLTAGLDVLRDEGRAYAARLVGDGVALKFHEAAGLIHGLVSVRKALPSAVPILDRCIDDLKSYLG